MTVDPPPAWYTAMPSAARPYQGRRAGIVSRLLANVVDVIVVALVVALLYLGVAGLVFAVNPTGFSFPALPGFSLALVGSVVGIGYFAGSWLVTGRTWGDQLLGLRVLSRRGRRLGAGRSLLRSVVCVVFPLGLLWVLVDGAARRSLQDLLVGTVVVYDWQPLSRDR
jgi:uncharacterized RDD family membrane protein YckC